MTQWECFIKAHHSPFGLNLSATESAAMRFNPALTSQSSDSPVLAGLLCGHERCDALFTDIEDYELHAAELHDGVVLAKTCAVREVVDSCGTRELALVPDDGQFRSRMTRQCQINTFLSSQTTSNGPSRCTLLLQRRPQRPPVPRTTKDSHRRRRSRHHISQFPRRTATRVLELHRPALVPHV